MTLVTGDGRWPCSRGAKCFAPCPGCPHVHAPTMTMHFEVPNEFKDVKWEDMKISVDWSSEEMDRRRAWTAYLMGFAEHAATKSKDSTRVGAILVDNENSVLLTGYNGPPRGVQDTSERRSRENGVKYLFAVHAEINVLALAAKKGIRTEGMTMFTTHMCCASCTRAMIQAGIRKVVYGPGKTSMPDEEFEAARTMFEESGVVLEEFDAS